MGQFIRFATHCQCQISLCATQKLYQRPRGARFVKLGQHHALPFEAGITLESLTPVRASLEDTFFEMTGE